MHTQNTVEMAGPLEEIVQLASDIERWPEILPHYRWVKLLDGGGDRKVVEMAAKRDWIPVKRRAIQEIRRDGQTPVIHFSHIGGPTKGMEVDWLFDPQPDRVLVTIRHDFAPPWPVVGNAVANQIIGPHFVGAIAGRTLATIKRIVEGDDPRFPR